MPSILDYLNTISDARYGRDVRQAIVDAISACYQDGKAGVSDLEARRLIESAIGVNESQQADIDTLYAQIAEIQGGGGESSQESTTITLDTVIYDGGFVDSVTVNNNATKTYDVTFTQTFTEVPEVFACVAVQNSAAASYSKVTVGIVKAQTTTTGFRFFIANTSGATRSTTVVWAAFQPTTKEIDLDITIPSGEGMSEADVLAITNPIQTALNGVKTGYDGTEYSTPGEAVRTQINDLHVLIGDEPGTAINASSVGYEDGSVADALDGLNGRLDGLGDGVPTEVREAIYNLFSMIPAYTGDPSASRTVLASWKAVVTSITLNVSTASISGANTSQLVATTTPAGGTVTWASSDTNVATVSNNGLVTGVGNGTATITASCGGKTARCTVTVSGFATLSSITAVYTPSGMVYNTETLDSLKSNLVVTGTYSDSSTATITNYTLSGTLTVGTSTITVTYEDKTTTFTVTVSERWEYHINDLTKVIGPLGNSSDATCGLALEQKTGSSNSWRRSFVLNKGETSVAIISKPSGTIIVSQTSDYYPIKVPAGATSFTVTVTPSTQYVQVLARQLNDGVYTTLSATGTAFGYQQQTITRSFDDGAVGDNAYLCVSTKYDNAGGSYPTEPTGLDVIFS